MAQPDLSVLGASCLAHLCISSKSTSSSLLDRARELDSGFFEKRDYKRYGKLQFVHLMHNSLEFIIFPSSTKDVCDWLCETGNLETDMTDISHYRRHLRNPLAHSGFVTTIDKVWGNLRHVFDQRPDTKVVFLGLSRGGACAAMAALRMNDDKRLAAVVTFAQPRCVHKDVANEVFQNIWGRRYFRFAGSGDPVPLTPIGDGYDHGRTCIHMMTTETIDYRGQHTDRVEKILIGVIDTVSSGRNPLRGHGIEWYIENAAYATSSRDSMSKTKAMSAFLAEILPDKSKHSRNTGKIGNSDRRGHMNGVPGTSQRTIEYESSSDSDYDEPDCILQ